MEVVLLPGMDGTGRLLTRFAEALSERSLAPRIVTYPPDEVMGYEALLETIEVPAAPAVIVAESFSGPLGVLLAARHPDRAVGLVLAASFARDPTWMAARLGARIGPSLFRHRPPRVALRAALAGWRASHDTLAALEEALSLVHPTVMSARLREIARVDVRAALARSRVPLVYLAGRRDRLVPARVAHEVLRLRADCELVWVDAPHLLLQHAPGEAAERVAAFAQRAR